MAKKMGRGSFLGSIAETISRGVGGNLSVSRRGLNKTGLSGAVAPGVKKARVTGPVAGGATSANLSTGRGTGKRFISNEQYSQIHEMRGRKIIGGGIAAGAIGMTGRSSQNKSAYNPMPAPKGSGRYA